MNRERVSHALAICCGILIGSLTAQSIAHYFEHGKYFWFFGALFGGAIAYIGVDVRKTITGTMLAFKQSWQQFSDWQPDRRYWKTVAFVVVGNMSWITSVLILVFTGSNFLSPLSRLNCPEFFLASETYMFVLCLLVGFGQANGTSLTRIHDHEMWFAIKFLNPIMFIFTVLYTAYRVLRYIAERHKTIGHFFRRFIQLAFFYTHNERRTPSLIFAAIGGTIGFFVGYTLIVAIAGAMIGVLEFELTKSIRERLSNQLRHTI